MVSGKFKAFSLVVLCTYMGFFFVIAVSFDSLRLNLLFKNLNFGAETLKTGSVNHRLGICIKQIQSLRCFELLRI